jgi:hypothetical protein
LGPPSPLRRPSRLALAPTGPTASSPSSATERELRRQHNDLGRCLRHISANPREQRSSCSRRRVDAAAGTRTSRRKTLIGFPRPERPQNSKNRGVFLLRRRVRRKL